MSPLGISRSRQDVRPPADAGELGKLTVEDLDGREVRLRELWRDRPAVLVFLRHYG
jgi:hypothetical protein